jgi:hypothetical protein
MRVLQPMKQDADMLFRFVRFTLDSWAALADFAAPSSLQSRIPVPCGSALPALMHMTYLALCCVLVSGPERLESPSPMELRYCCKVTVLLSLWM